MGVLRADHPDLETFLHAKDEAGKLTNFNISIAVTDDFMEAVKNDEMWDLVHVAEPSDGAVHLLIWYCRHGRVRFANSLSVHCRMRNSFCNSFSVLRTALVLG